MGNAQVAKFENDRGVECMNNRMWPFVLALVVAGVALLGVRNHLKQREAQLEEKYAKGVKVVAVKKDMKKGDRIEREHLYPKEIPTRFVPELAVRGEDAVRTVTGMTLNRPVPANDILLWTDVEKPDYGGLAGQIPPNERGYTLRVTQGVDSGLIRPNDHVDILGTFTLPSSRPKGLSASVDWKGEPQTVNVVLLQDVTVLGVGGTTGKQMASSGGGGGGLTVAVTLQEAQLLMFAAQHGELGAVLRRNEDFQNLSREQLPKITFESVVELIGTLDDRRRERLIEVQRGSRGTSELVPVTHSAPKQ